MPRDLVVAVLLGALAAATSAAPAPRHGSGGAAMRSDLIDRTHVGPFAWSNAQWRSRCRGVRTSYNRDHDLTDDALTLRPADPRWLDFVFWSLNNKVNEHQFEAYGGTGWNGPKGGILFHWAPGSHWERDTLHSYGFTIGHIVGEHRWTDTMFPDFFEKYGGVYGVNVKDRLFEIAPGSPAPWIAFLNYVGGPNSSYFRYLLHVDAAVDIGQHRIALSAGQGIAFNYSFDRYRHELAMILTDCKAVDFFEMYDRFGAGFAAEGNWAHQSMPPSALASVGYADHVRYAADLGPGGAVPSSATEPARVGVPADLPDAARTSNGSRVYFSQCVDCHGASGDGAGFLAEGFDVKPRDFRQGKYKFRSTAWGELPTMSDLERSIRDGVAGTTMPGWSQFLTKEEIRDVARYLVVFSPRFAAAWKARAEPKPLAMSPVPAEVATLSSHPTGQLHPCGAAAGPEPSSLACRGEQLWNIYQCRWCHGDDRRGDGPTAAGLKDEWGNASRPADLTYKWLFKNGHEPKDVYRAVFGGFNGTAMQSYAPFVPQESDRWALVAYVLSLSPASRPVLHLSEFAAQRAIRIGADGRVAPTSLQEQ